MTRQAKSRGIVIESAAKDTLIIDCNINGSDIGIDNQGNNSKVIGGTINAKVGIIESGNSNSYHNVSITKNIIEKASEFNDSDFEELFSSSPDIFSSKIEKKASQIIIHKISQGSD